MIRWSISPLASCTVASIPIDNARALGEYERGLRLAPDDAELLSAAAIAEALLQRWDDVVPRLERAVQLDPRSLTPPPAGWPRRASSSGSTTPPTRP